VPKLLVVDDDPEIRSTLKKLLELSGHQVELAASGREALQRLSEGGIELMITDIVMPDMDGLENLKTARSELPDLPIIAMSGGGSLKTENYLRLAQAFGARKVLQKPFDTQDLLKAVSELLEP
jgi:two-component system, chemotaxis family, chemotaxis protein CheY